MINDQNENNINTNDEYEEILDPKFNRMRLYPINNKYKLFWDAYKDQVSKNWSVGEIEISKDRNHFNLLTKDEQHSLKMILTFFSSADGYVNFNLDKRFTQEIQIPEINCALTFQTHMENIHAETYGILLENIITDEREMRNIDENIKNIPSLKI